LGAGHFGIFLSKGGSDEGGDDAPAVLTGMRQDIAQEVHGNAATRRAALWQPPF